MQGNTIWQEGDQELLLFGALVQGGSLVLRVVRALFTLLEALVCSEVDTAASQKLPFVCDSGEATSVFSEDTARLPCEVGRVSKGRHPLWQREGGGR